MQRWTVGNVRSTRVLELERPTKATILLPDATPERLAPHADWLRPRFLDERGRMIASVYALKLAKAMRRAFLERCRDQPILVFGAHFATPSAGHVVRHDGSWRFV